MLLRNKLFRHPVRFIVFAAVGGVGLFVHLAILYLALHMTTLNFAWSQTVAIMVAMTGNYALNNIVTYRDKRLRGAKFIYGLFMFYLACGIGAVANVGVASFLYGRDEVWWLAGLAGAIVGAVWNYAISSIFIWSDPKKG